MKSDNIQGEGLREHSLVRYAEVTFREGLNVGSGLACRKDVPRVCPSSY